MTPSLSIVIPVLNEADQIGDQLEHVARIPGVNEVIVVDGGSDDETVRNARARSGSLNLRVASSERGRAAQMNAGARLASADTLLFLHADVRLPSDAASWVSQALSDERVIAGAFRTWTVPNQRDSRRRASWLAGLLHLADVRSRYSRMPYGDQALFVRAETFRELGGFADLPLMEDVDLARRLRRLGRIHIVAARVTVSGRRFVARPVYYTLLVNVYPALFRLGVSAATLARFYRPVR